jgi:hypothetical protein
MTHKFSQESVSDSDLESETQWGTAVHVVWQRIFNRHLNVRDNTSLIDLQTQLEVKVHVSVPDRVCFSSLSGTHAHDEEEQVRERPWGFDTSVQSRTWRTFLDISIFLTHYKWLIHWFRESFDDTLHHLLLWDIEFIIDEPVDETEEEPEVWVYIIFTLTYFVCWGFTSGPIKPSPSGSTETCRRKNDKILVPFPYASQEMW